MLMLNTLPSLNTVRVKGLSAPPCMLSLTMKPPFLFTIKCFNDNDKETLLNTYILKASALPSFYPMTCTMVGSLSPPLETRMTKNSCYCQAQVQVPNLLSQQAPNPDFKVRPSLKKTKNPILWTGADTIITWATTTPPHPPNNFSA